MIRTSDSTKFLTAALVEFHKSEVSIPKTAANPFFKSKYADLWTIKAACDPVLSNLGLVVVQFPGIVDGQPTLITRLSHGASGEFMEAETPLFMPKDTPQDQGSAITYLRRYSYSAILGIVADPDDDGERAMQRDRPKSRARASQPVFIPPTTNEDQLADVLHESLAQRSDDSPSDPATGKQLSYLRSLIRDNGMADADTATMVGQHCPPWPGDIAKLNKGQAGKMIELLKG